MAKDHFFEKPKWQNQSTVHRHRKELGTSQSPIYCMDATKGTGSENLVFLNLYFLQHLMSIKKQYTIHNYISHIRDVSNQSRCMSTIGITTSRRQKNIPATCRLPWDNDENIPSHPSIIIMEWWRRCESSSFSRRLMMRGGPRGALLFWSDPYESSPHARPPDPATQKESQGSSLLPQRRQTPDHEKKKETHDLRWLDPNGRSYLEMRCMVVRWRCSSLCLFWLCKSIKGRTSRHTILLNNRSIADLWTFLYVRRGEHRSPYRPESWQFLIVTSVTCSIRKIGGVSCTRKLHTIKEFGQDMLVLVCECLLLPRSIDWEVQWKLFTKQCIGAWQHLFFKLMLPSQIAKQNLCGFSMSIAARTECVGSSRCMLSNKVLMIATCPKQVDRQQGISPNLIALYASAPPCDQKRNYICGQ